MQEITITPKFIGSRPAYDVAYLLMKSYYVFVKQLPPRANFKVKAEMKFVSNKGGDDYGAHSKVFLKKDAAQWGTEYSNAIYSMSQSEDEVDLKTLKWNSLLL